ncbi:putative oxidoreductase GLYR1 homolog [Nephila pilipes]|nr:putative oxidoreductase GLYR1 homolog [Nephila pilipes]
MKKYPFWPGEITEPPPGSKLPKKPQHYVFFFGSDNCAWIPDENIVPHSEKMLLSCSKCKSIQFQKAVDKIRKEGLIFKKKGKKKENDEEEISVLEEINVKLSKVSQSVTMYVKSIGTKESKIKYETAKKQYFKKFQKKSENRYITRIHKKTRKHFVTFKNKNTISTEDQPKNTISTEDQPKESHPTQFHCVAINRLLEDFSHPSLDSKNIEATNKKIGFIGLGMMGRRIVRNIIDSGHSVTVWNQTLSKCEEFVKSGAAQAFTPADLVAECDITFSCVSGTEAVKSLVFRDDGIIRGLHKSQSLIKGYVDLSTVDPGTSEELASAIINSGGKFLEAPVSGSMLEANSGSLLVLAAGDFELFNYCESCFFAMSTNAYYLSTVVGSGSKMNLLLSMFLGSTYTALAEALALIERCGLSPANFLEFLDNSPLSCRTFINNGQTILSRDFSNNTSLNYLQKNLNMALVLGDVCEQPMLLSAATNERYKQARRLPFLNPDVSQVYWETE